MCLIPQTPLPGRSPQGGSQGSGDPDQPSFPCRDGHANVIAPPLMVEKAFTPISRVHLSRQGCRFIPLPCLSGLQGLRTSSERFPSPHVGCPCCLLLPGPNLGSLGDLRKPRNCSWGSCSRFFFLSLHWGPSENRPFGLLGLGLSPGPNPEFHPLSPGWERLLQDLSGHTPCT